ncbi:Gfo/Idh/MocA family protein [Abditibacterium utsteinense]|nr:Gfo/Idh/MocA family oxidoreductase [Abditibacterium utsteinense]
MQITAFLGVAHIHTPGFIKTINNRADVGCKYVYDHDDARAQKRAAELNSSVASVDMILGDTEVTSVVICSETRHHLDLVVRAARAGKNIFVEKPLAITGEEAEQIAAEVEKAGVTFQTGFFMRSAPSNIFIKQEIEAGNLGTITRMRYTNCHQGALAGWFDAEWAWIADKNEAGGGGFADLGAHALDIVLWALTPTCGKAVKFAATLGNATNRYPNIDEWGAGLVTFESGAVAVVEAGWVDPNYSAPVEVHGTQGQILVHDGKVFYFSENVEGADGKEWTDLPAKLPHAFEMFWDELEGKGASLVSVQGASDESRVMHQLYLSAEK